MHTIISNLLILLLVLRLSCFRVLVPVSAKVFMSIGCGYPLSEPYTDGNSIDWVGDQQYIQTGESRRVIDPTAEKHPWNTVREFTSRKKNCYSLDVFNTKAEGSTKVERILLRATFRYGNYDNEATPPTFNLQFNGNNWSQIETSMHYTTYKEVVFSLNHGKNISVCLAQTQRNHFPFISAIEVRSLDSDMYGYVDSDYPLIFMLRKPYGTNANIKYPDDSYDRLWISHGPETARVLTWINNTSPVVKVDISDNTPEALFRTALTSLNSSGRIWTGGIIKNLIVPLHFNAYFTEMIRLSSTQKRSFDINVLKIGDNVPSFYETVSPPYGRALQVRIGNVTTNSNDAWNIGLIPTKDSTLPPLISALEAYIIGDKLVQGTNATDVNSLTLLRKSFSQLQDWQGDPCLPSPYTWDWVACDSDTDSPRITALYLNDLGLAGTLPDFNDMDALETIDLGSNYLTGNIPEFLGTFPKLKVLNLAHNDFCGAIPSSLLNNNNLRLSVSGNPNLSTNNNTSTNRNSTEPKIASTSISKTSITSTIPIIILGCVIIQMW